ncbi:hypothetical protein PMAA_064800 [Talaromyces marneffei ATCC 18224]|uniref:Uncharacterized protein n=1 Tax=Talaromyces marneffei (strain ATCC 18224 / CBS 334.59 / QM 7333) TaxID=441960 RepID=B6QB28_TALMQ|nr:hypothetical protein PMAA_064800 [Talaromyces marneffei ATCC 18224]
MTYFRGIVVQTLYDIPGAYPIFHVNGSTQNSAVCFPNQTDVAIINPFGSGAADQPSHSHIGPSFMESCRRFLEGTMLENGGLDELGLNSFFQPENGTLCNVDDELGQGVLEATLRTRRWEARCMDFEIGNPVNYKSYQYQQKIRNFQADEKQRESVALVRLPTGLGKTTLMSQNLSS